jgi:hypothetical protein
LCGRTHLSETIIISGLCICEIYVLFYKLCVSYSLFHVHLCIFAVHLPTEIFQSSAAAGDKHVAALHRDVADAEHADDLEGTGVVEEGVGGEEVAQCEFTCGIRSAFSFPSASASTRAT